MTFDVWRRFFAENAQNDPKMHSYEDSAKFNSAFSATRRSHASRFWRKRRVIENLEYLCEFEEYFQKCWLDCVSYLLVTEICKKKFKNRLWKSRACVPLTPENHWKLNLVEKESFCFSPVLNGRQTALFCFPLSGRNSCQRSFICTDILSAKTQQCFIIFILFFVVINLKWVVLFYGENCKMHRN